MPHGRQWIERTGHTVVKEGIWLSRTVLSGHLTADSGTLALEGWPVLKDILLISYRLGATFLKYCSYSRA